MVATMHLIKDGVKSKNSDATVITADKMKVILIKVRNRAGIDIFVCAGGTGVSH